MIGKPLKQLDAGIAGTQWGVDFDDNVYSILNGNQRKVSGKLIHVSSGESGVWGVGRDKYVYFRKGVTARRKTGSMWTRVGEGFKQVDSGPFGIVCAVNDRDQIFCRGKITSNLRAGVNWIRVPGSLIYISCGLYGHWGVGKDDNVFFRYGVKPTEPQGYCIVMITRLVCRISVITA